MYRENINTNIIQNCLPYLYFYQIFFLPEKEKFLTSTDEIFTKNVFLLWEGINDVATFEIKSEVINVEQLQCDDDWVTLFTCV